jgi:hypothetical protein
MAYGVIEGLSVEARTLQPWDGQHIDPLDLDPPLASARTSLRSKLVDTWKIDINHDTERTYFIATISDPRLKKLKFPGVTNEKRSFMLKQFESEYIAHWSPAPLQPPA